MMQELESTVNLIEPGYSLERICQILEAVEMHARKAREIKKKAEEAILEWMDANGIREFELGQTRYYKGHQWKRKCKDKAEVIELILRASGGNLKAVAECLAADGLLYGRTKSLLGEGTVEALWHSEWVTDLKTGKPKPALKQIPKAMARANYLEA